jgi:MscS family membrane protein
MNDLLQWWNEDRFLNHVVLSNPVKAYLVVAGVVMLVLAVKRFVSRYLAGVLFGVFNRVWKNLDKQLFKNLVAQPLGTFLLIFVTIISLHKLRFPEELNVELYDYSLDRIVHCVGSIILVISFAQLLLRSIDFISTILEKKAIQTADRTDDQLVVFFRDFFKVIVIIISILMIMRFAFHLNIGNLLTGLSIIGAAVALALRESLENLIASFIIFFDKPFTQGDLVKVQNITGNIEKIGLRSTRIRTDQKSYVSVPNKQMVDSILDNLSLRTQLKAELRLQLSLSTGTAKLEQLEQGIRAILDHKKVESRNVYLNDIAVNAFLLNVDYFMAPMTYAEFTAFKEEINMSVLKLMTELGIELAGSSTDIRLKTDLPGGNLAT